MAKVDRYAEYFSRQVRLPQFGERSQLQLKDRKCLIVGMGGLGCPVAQYLAASGIGNIGICDDDVVEYSNISRQILYTCHDLSKKKTNVAAKRLHMLYPFLKLTQYTQRLNEENCLSTIRDYDLVVDCTDNFHTKYLIHDACLYLNIPLVQGGIYQKHGQVFVLPFSTHRAGPCMRCVWRMEPEADCVLSCAESGVLNVVAGTVALSQCISSLHILLGTIKGAEMKIFTYEEDSWQNIAMPIQDSCICQAENKDTLYEFERLIHGHALEVDVLPETTDWELLDLRQPDDQKKQRGLSALPVVAVSEKEVEDPKLLLSRLSKEKTYILMCYRGILSLKITKKLRACGYPHTYSIAGGYGKLEHRV